MDCTLNDPDIRQCCCNCAHLLPVHYHCCTEPKPPNANGCVCGVQKGWACVAPEMGRVYDNWPLHSIGCELYTKATDLKQAGMWDLKHPSSKELR